MRVLIADDEALARKRLAAMLRELGAEYELAGCAKNGNEALIACARGDIDLVLMDISMPEMDGLSAARNLASLQTPPAVVITTAHAEHALAAFTANAVGYLLKPVRKANLLDALQNAARLTRAQLERLPETAADTKRYINASSRGALQRIALDDVIILRAAAKYVEVIHLAGEALLDESLTSLEERFPNTFLRIHRNALVNHDFLTGLTRSRNGKFQAVLRATELRPNISRRHVAAVRHWLKGGQR